MGSVGVSPEQLELHCACIKAIFPRGLSVATRVERKQQSTMAGKLPPYANQVGLRLNFGDTSAELR